MANIDDQRELDFSIFPSKLIAEALRDSGYKDTDHAIAELIDNSIDADARHVELIVVDRPPEPGVRYARAQTCEIAVADDGSGMDRTTLRRSLRYGDGRPDRKRIGRFGVGLPNASMSQCRRVDIWTWQNGCDNAMRCHLDLDEIKSGVTEIAEPVNEPVPERWRKVVSSTSELTGTLVVWSELDRVKWQGGKKTLEHTGRLCGRLYRHFINDPRNPRTITLALATESKGNYVLNDDDVRDCFPNDPLYLMAPSSNAVPFHDRPMFRTFNDRQWTVEFTNDLGIQTKGDIYVTCSMALEDAINQQRSNIRWPQTYPNPGDSPWGKDANRNLGVSIVRAKRELELSTAWVNNHEPAERWWSVEVKFDPTLDEVFGVVNNKQHAHNFVAGAGFDWRDIANGDETYSTLLERLRETGDYRAHLMEVWTWIKEQITAMRRERRAIVKGARGRTRHPDTGQDVEDAATGVIKNQPGKDGTTDQHLSITPKEKEDQIKQSLEAHKIPTTEADLIAKDTVIKGRRVIFQSVPGTDTRVFFHVRSVGDVIEVLLNANHAVHRHLFEALDDDPSDREGLSERLNRASFSLKMLLIAWARYEDKLPLDEKQRAEDVRMDWGREARDFLQTYES